MNEIHEYTLATGADAEQLGQRVTELLAHGWQPFGNPVSKNDGWAQAMVKTRDHSAHGVGTRFRRMGE